MKYRRAWPPEQAKACYSCGNLSLSTGYISDASKTSSSSSCALAWSSNKALTLQVKDNSAPESDHDGASTPNPKFVPEKELFIEEFSFELFI
jgi:hypothetical protein